jgi:hypothetical protein
MNYYMGLTIEDVRQMALSLSEVEEHQHWDRPSFRVKGKIFLTLWPVEQRAVLKLAPDVQRELIKEEPNVYSVVSGAWGQRGYTNARLQCVEAKEFTAVMEMAWRQVAPRGLNTPRP